MLVSAILEVDFKVKKGDRGTGVHSILQWFAGYSTGTGIAAPTRA